MMWDTLYKKYYFKENGYFAHWVNLITIPRPQLALHSDHVDHCSKKRNNIFLESNCQGPKSLLLKINE